MQSRLINIDSRSENPFYDVASLQTIMRIPDEL